MSDRIIVMHEGTQTGEFMRDELDQDMLMAYAIGEGHKKDHSRKGEEKK